MAGSGSPEAASSPDSNPKSPPSVSPPEESRSPPESGSSESPPTESPPQSPPKSESPPPSSPPPSSPPPSSPPPPDSSPPPNSQPPPSPTNNNSQPPPSSSNNNSVPPPPDSSNDNSSSSPADGRGSNNPSPHVPNRPPDSRRPDFSPPSPGHGSSNNELPSADSGVSGGSSGSSSSSMDDHKIPILIGAAAAVALLLMIIVCLVCGRRKKRKHDIPYAWDRGPSKAGKQYWIGAQGKDHAVKIPPTPGGNTAGGWTQPVPTPPMMGNSSEMSSPFTGPSRAPVPTPSPALSLGMNTTMFAYEDLAAATNGFAQTNMLGHGGFGFVHKGVLPNGKAVAVKSLKSGSTQGEREFQSEVEIISRVHHRHLVSLVGYCIAGGQRMLVYEFVPNDNLEFHLHKRADTPLDFSTRLKIALGSAKGLAYLHEDCHPRIIHRDIKASNILLDYNFEAQVADFGLAKLTNDTSTHVSTRVMGTFGYLAPEYASSGKLTEKSDVFSFGVMLLELITGRRPVDPKMSYMEDSLVDWARPLLSRALEDGNFNELADPRLEQNYSSLEMARMVACAAASIRHSARRRPKMSQIVRALEGDVSLEDLNEGAKPGQSTVFSSSTGSSDYDASQYSADLKKFRQMAFGSQEFGSNVYDGNTSEYGLNPSASSTSSESSREFRQQKVTFK